MEKVYLACAVIGGTLVVCQFLATLLGLGGHHDMGGGHDIAGSPIVVTNGTRLRMEPLALGTLPFNEVVNPLVCKK